MPPKSTPMTQAAIRRMIKESVDTAIVAERARQANIRNDASGSGPVRGAVELRRWFEETKSIFEISECVEGKKVKFVVATLEGPALTWWKTKVATIGLETVNQMPWTEMKQLMTVEFCPIEEVQRIEHELWNLKVKAYDVGLTDNIKGEVTSSKPADLNKAVCMAHKLMEQKSQARDARILEGKKRKKCASPAPTDGKLPLCERCFTRHVGQCTIKCHKCGKVGHKARYCKEKSVVTSANSQPVWTCYNCSEQGHTRNRCPKKVKQEEAGEIHGRAYAIKDTEPQGPNVVTGTFLLNNRYAFVLFDSGSDRSFMDTRFSSMLDIDPVKIGASYKVELADGRVVSTNTVLKGCTLNLVNHIFKIDLMPIELGTFDVIISMDWLVKHGPIIVCGEKVVCIPYGNKMLIVESDKGVNEFPVFHDNIHQFQQTAAVGNFIQRNPPNLENQMRPPGFNQPNVQNNQGNQSRYQGNNFNSNQNRGNNFNQNHQNNQGQVYQPPTNQPPVYQVPPYQAPMPQIQGVLKTDFENYVKANDAVLKNVQNQGQNLQNQMANVTSLLTSLCNNFKNSASTSNSGTLPSQTVTNPRQQINAITTRSGKTLEGPSTPLVPTPVVSIPSKEPEQNPETSMDKVQKPSSESTAQVPPPEEEDSIFIEIPKPKAKKTVNFVCSYRKASEKLGASINIIASFTLSKSLGYPGHLMILIMVFEVADRTISKPTGVAKNVFVKVGKFYFLADFVVLDFIADPRVSLILGRPFLRTAHALIDVMKKVDLIDVTCEEYSQEVLGFSDEIAYGNPSPGYMSDTCSCSSRDSNFNRGVDEAYYDSEGTFSFLESLLIDNNKFPVIIAKDLSDDEKTALIKVLKSRKQAIAWKLSDIKGINPEFCSHKILMEEDYEPTVQHQRRVNPKIHDVIKKEVEKLLDAGLIYPISDMPTRLVTGWRVCIDYRKLNEATRKDHFPLPFMDQMLERLAGNEFYCFLDGFSGYFQIPIDPKDQEKTTFTCPYGTFAYRRMPFGLCNAPGTFQRCMMAIFHDMIEKTMEVFMDDFSVFGNSFSTCLTNLDKMRKQCEDTNLALNWEKIHFMVKEGIVLGHKISKKGIKVDKAKIDVISKLPHPTTVKGIQSFLGHAGFYPFQTLKKKLTEAPILIAPNWDQPFELMCDASDYAIGAVLGQRIEKNFRPILYASKTMTEAETNYTTMEKEMLAVVYAFEKFRSYLIMNKSVVYTDHSAFKLLFNKKDCQSKIA
ncbi:reverse transcriptase domain-containing protein [Tanacetum coccineum]